MIDVFEVLLKSIILENFQDYKNIFKIIKFKEFENTKIFELRLFNGRRIKCCYNIKSEAYHYCYFMDDNEYISLNSTSDLDIITTLIDNYTRKNCPEVYELLILKES